MKMTIETIQRIQVRILFLLLSCVSTCALASNVAGFRSCITSSSYTTCTLDPGTYYISSSAPINDSGPTYQPFVIMGNSLTVQGTLSGSSIATNLYRNDTSTGSLMSYGSSINSGVIEYFFFDGNRSLWGSTLNCGPTGTYVCPEYQDLDLYYTVATTEYAIEVTNCQFNSAPRYAVRLGNDSVVEWSSFYSNFDAAILSYGASNVGIYETYFTETGDSAVAIGAGASTASIQWNQFYYNDRECGDGSGGGQVEVDYTTSNVVINNNYFDGGWSEGYMLPGCYAQAVEIYGNNNSILSNTITNQNVEGIIANGVSNLTLGAESGYSANDVTSNARDGIQLGNDLGTCSSSVTFSGDTFASNGLHGISVYQSGCSISIYGLSSVSFSPANTDGNTNFTCGSGGVTCY